MLAPHADLSDWEFEDAPPTRLDGEPEDATIAEADLSAIGLFRLETRPVAGGFAVVVRHAEALADYRLEMLGASVAAEAERFGVGARVRFVHDPALRPGT